MARITVKATYALNVETARALEDMALDTNFLIRGLIHGSAEDRRLRDW